MNPPNDYDVETDLRKVARARADADELTRAIASIGDATADGFRARFDMTMDMEHAGLTLMIGAAMLSPIANRGDTSASVLADALAMAAENLVRTARSRDAEAREAEGVLCEHVLTWHPVDEPDDALGVEIPLYQHIELPSGLGELRSHTREIPAPADKLPVWEDDSDRAYREMVDGRVHPRLGEPLADIAGRDGQVVARPGKKAAGRVFDGRTWDEYPESWARRSREDGAATGAPNQGGGA